jgi:Helix-turn-helix domain
MAAQIMTAEDFEVFKTELLDEIQKMIDVKMGNVRRWLKSNDVIRMLKISEGTLQNLRLNGTIPYTKIGGVIFYDLEELNKVMMNHKQND